MNKNLIKIKYNEEIVPNQSTKEVQKNFQNTEQMIITDIRSRKTKLFISVVFSPNINPIVRQQQDQIKKTLAKSNKNICRTNNEINNKFESIKHLTKTHLEFLVQKHDRRNQNLQSIKFDIQLKNKIYNEILILTLVRRKQVLINTSGHRFKIYM
ncbi:unnamed protein product [Paramecium octaurelia]|uniref:Uncharacterized protein n=1 Tax=Paramecium octaurelia TaxID=43137 RepID=A0A8S1WGE4_PAROT|nr:unnamed protein product [Paramecium octaurelia]